MITLKDSDYDKTTGLSYVEIETELGVYCGNAILHDDDKENASGFFGCEIAEYRATIEYFKDKIRILNIELNALYDVYRKDEGLSIANPVVDQIKKRIKQKEEYKAELKRNIKSLKEVIQIKIDNRDKYLEKIKKIKESK